MNSRSVAVASIAATLIGLGTLALSPTVRAQSPAPTRAGFSWEMPERYGRDVDRDGRVEIENSYSYVTGRRLECTAACPPQRFLIALRAQPAGVDLGINPSLFSYEWRIDGPTGRATHFRSDPGLSVWLAEGTYDIDLRVKVRVPWGSVTLRKRARGDVDVEDHLIVALGDSYISGEGNPEIPRSGDDEARWADASDPAIEETHARAHRSTVGWAAQVAAAQEAVSRESSVTFVDLAASSARVGAGVLRPHSYLGLEAQLEQLRSIVGERHIDVVLLQVGGNDIGFSEVIRGLVDADPLLDPICYDVMLSNLALAVKDGRWDRDVALTYNPPFGIGCRSTGGMRTARAGLEGLAREFDRLAEELSTFDIGRIVVVEYPDPTGGTALAETCDEIVGDTTPPFGFHEVDEQEQLWGVENVLGPLNTALEGAAARHGWDFVGGVASAFSSGHGYCAPWPDYGYPDEYLESPFIFRDRLDYPEGWYQPPGLQSGPLQLTRGVVSWYRTAPQSAALQGPTPRFLTAGTLHPNELGHTAIARMVLEALADSD